MDLKNCKVCNNHSLDIKNGLICNLTSKKPLYDNYCDDFKYNLDFIRKYRNQSSNDFFDSQKNSQKYSRLSKLNALEDKEISSITFAKINKRIPVLFSFTIVILAGLYILLFEDFEKKLNGFALIATCSAVIYIIYDFYNNGMIRNYPSIRLDNEAIHFCNSNKKIPWHHVLDLRVYSKYINSNKSETYISLDLLFQKDQYDIKISDLVASKSKVCGYFKYYLDKSIKDKTLHNNKYKSAG
jgi:hypothetical protein